MSDTLQKIIAHFERLPGVGPRQASRFAYALLNAPKGVLKDFGALLQELPESVHQCPLCGLYHAEKAERCRYCSDTHRDSSILMVVAKDTDVFALERAGVFKGYYVILGSLLPVVGDGSIREALLQHALAVRSDVQEIILALPATPEGDLTGDRVKEIMRGANPKVKISLFGRGLATGTEIEYSDKETLRSAFQNRK
jgi:recombination protein RecR